ncbi:hypothetical protein [Lichenihabitans psoromatis]|uniref:hypothetical protein n=1 Tax=Lichenihabitans psoromatis TaxID=2528642 RepID=UPI001035FA12|nr:hypothetical protein [Lichenihabitans psoromatis]
MSWEIELLKRRLAAAQQRARTNVSAALETVAQDMIDLARQSLSGTTSPSDAGVSETLGWRSDPADPSVVVTATSPAAVFLEYGTMQRAAKPFFRPAAEAASEAAQQPLAAAFARSVSGEGS